MIDTLRLLNDLAIPTDPRVSPDSGWVNISCPFCRESSDHYHFGFKIGDEYGHCWKCGGASIRRVLRELLHKPGSELDAIISQYDIGGNVRKQLNKKASATELKFEFDPLTSAEKRYLKKRGFVPEELEQKYQLRSGGVVGDWAYRIIIPLFLNGVVVGWTARDISGKSDLRYRTLDLVDCVRDPKTIFYNVDNCRGKTAAILEGPADVWRMGDGFICSFGTSITEAQIKFLKSRFDKVFFIFDPEPMAQKKARRFALSSAALGLKVELVDLETDCDPGDLSPEEAKKIANELFGR